MAILGPASRGGDNEVASSDIPSRTSQAYLLEQAVSCQPGVGHGLTSHADPAEDMVGRLWWWGGCRREGGTVRQCSPSQWFHRPVGARACGLSFPKRRFACSSRLVQPRSDARAGQKASQNNESQPI